MSLVKIAPIWQPASQQAVFRGLLSALSFPGHVIDIAEPLAGERAALGVLAALVDEHVRYADPDSYLSQTERRLLALQEPLDANHADYIVCNAARAVPHTFAPRLGTIYRPEGGALLILTCDSVEHEGFSLELSGPGVETRTTLSLSGVHVSWLAARETWCQHFPAGCDLVFCSQTKLAAIPRTTRVEVKN